MFLLIERSGRAESTTVRHGRECRLKQHGEYEHQERRHGAPTSDRITRSHWFHRWLSRGHRVPTNGSAAEY
jgi:hypothetical protein